MKRDSSLFFFAFAILVAMLLSFSEANVIGIDLGVESFKVFLNQFLFGFLKTFFQ